MLKTVFFMNGIINDQPANAEK